MNAGRVLEPGSHGWAVAVSHRTVVGVISGMCRGKVHAYAGTLCTGEPER